MVLAEKEDVVSKKILFAILISVMAFSVALAKKQKTVVIKDNIAADTAYGWTMPVPKNWKSKTFNEPNVERLFLQKKNYLVNSSVRSYGGDYTIPTVAVFIQEFEGTTDDFENLIIKSLEEHRSDNSIISKFGLLKDSEYVVSGDVSVNSTLTRQIYLKRVYKRVIIVPDGTSDGKEKIINDHEVHEIYLMKRGNALIVFQAFCEREFYDVNGPEFQSLLKSVEFSE